MISFNCFLVNLPVFFNNSYMSKTSISVPKDAPGLTEISLDYFGIKSEGLLGFSGANSIFLGS